MRHFDKDTIIFHCGLSLWAFWGNYIVVPLTSSSTDRLITFQSLMNTKISKQRFTSIVLMSPFLQYAPPHVLPPCPTSLKSTIRSEQTTKSSGVGGGEDRKQSNKSPLRCQLWTVFKATGPLLLLHQNSVNVVGSWGKYAALRRRTHRSIISCTKTWSVFTRMHSRLW